MKGQPSTIALTARAEGAQPIAETCFEVVELCNGLAVAIDLTVEDKLIAVQPGMHPYSLAVELKRPTG